MVPNIGQALKLTMVHSFRILWYRTSFIIISLVVLNAHVPGAKEGEVKGGRGSAPARKINFVSLVAYGPKVLSSALAMKGYSF